MNIRTNENAATMREDGWTREREPYAESIVQNMSTHASHVLREFLLREASDLLQQAIEAELEWFLSRSTAAVAGRRRTVVRNGYQPARELMTSLGPISIRLPKLRSRGDAAVFRTMLLRPYLRRTYDAVEEAPAIFLKALSEGRVQAAVRSVVGPAGGALPPMVMRRLQEHWHSRHGRWLCGALLPMRCEALWFDRVSFCRTEPGRQPTLVVMGHDDGAGPRLLASRSSADATDSWTEMLQSLYERGLRAGFRWAQANSVAGDVGAAVVAVFREIPRQNSNRRVQV